MAYNDLQSKAEAAAKSVVDALSLSGVTVTTGADDDAIVLPAVHCVCEGLAEVEGLIGTGLYRGALRIRVKSNANDTTLVAHRARVAAVFDALAIDTLKASLSSAVADFTCVFAGQLRQEQAVSDGQSWTSDLLVDGIFCASDV